MWLGRLGAGRGRGRWGGEACREGGRGGGVDLVRELGGVYTGGIVNR